MADDQFKGWVKVPVEKADDPFKNWIKVPVQHASPQFTRTIAPGKPVEIDESPADQTDYRVFDPNDPDAALGSGVSKGVSLGFDDEIGAGLDTALEGGQRFGDAHLDLAKRGLQKVGLMKPDPVLSPEDQELADEQHPQQPSLGDVYRKQRDAYRSLDQQAAQAHPVLHAAGEFAGAAVIPIPGTAEAGAGSAIARGVKTGVALGAGSGLGNSEADLTKGEFGKAAGDTALGGGVGGVLGGALGYFSGLAPKAAPKAGEQMFLADQAIQEGNQAIAGAANPLAPPQPDLSVRKAITDAYAAAKSKQGTLHKAGEIIPGVGTASKVADTANFLNALRQSQAVKANLAQAANSSLAQQTVKAAQNRAFDPLEYFRGKKRDEE